MEAFASYVWCSGNIESLESSSDPRLHCWEGELLSSIVLVDVMQVIAIGCFASLYAPYCCLDPAG